MTRRSSKGAIALALSLASSACGGDGEGPVEITAWGEAFIEEGIDGADFADGWSAQFDTFLIVLGDVTLAHADGGQAELGRMVLFDLVRPGPHPVGTTEPLEARNWERVGYRMGVADETTTAHGSASSDALTLMQQGGYSLYVEGSATDGTTTKTFAWGFSEAVRYERCVDVGGGQEIDGLVVAAGATTSMQMTIHGDHFFYDDLQSGEAELRFQNLADADADGDGEVTLEELFDVPLANLPPDRGPYGVGASNVDDLGGYLRAAVHTVGHFNGEGHCEVVVE